MPVVGPAFFRGAQAGDCPFLRLEAKLLDIPGPNRPVEPDSANFAALPNNQRVDIQSPDLQKQLCPPGRRRLCA